MAGSNGTFEAMLRRGDDFAAQNQWERAAQEYLAAVKAAPNEIPAREKLADSFYKIGRHQQALDALYMPLLKLRPANTSYLQPVAELQAKLGRSADAEGSFRKLVDIYKTQDRIDRAAEALNQLILLRPDDLALRTELAGLTALPDNALDELPPLDFGETTEVVTGGNPRADAPDHTPNAIDMLISRAEVALEHEDYDEAISLYEQAIDEGCTRADVYYSLGSLYMQAGRYEEADTALQRAAADEEYSPSAYYALAQMYAATNRSQDAAVAYELALNLIDLQTVGAAEAPELIIMYEGAAQTYTDLGNSTRAAQLYTTLAGFLQARRLNTNQTDRIVQHATELSGRNMQAQVQQKVHTAPTIMSAPEPLSQPETSRTAFLDAVTARKPNEGNAEQVQVFAPAKPTDVEKRRIANDLKLPPFQWPTKLVNDEITPDIEPYVKATYEFIQRKMYIPAIDASHEIIRYRPDYVPIHSVLAEIYLLQKRVDAARQKLQVVVDVYTVRGQKARALEAHTRLAQISPDNISLRTKLATAMIEAGDTTNAAEMLLGVAQSYIRDGQTERAIDELKSLRVMAPGSAAVRLQYADLMLRQHAYDDALTDYTRALELDPASADALIGTNIVLTLTDATDAKWGAFKALMDWVRSGAADAHQVIATYGEIAKENDHPGLFYALAAVELETGATGEALHHFEDTARVAATAVPPRTDYEALARLELGRLYLHQNAEEAIAQLGKVMKLENSLDPMQFGGANDRYGAIPSQLMVYRQLATAFLKLDRYDQALNALKFVKRARPYDRDVYLELAELYYRQNQVPAALSELYELVTYYEKNNQTDAMLDILREMARIAPTNPGVRDKMAKVLLDRGSIAEGLAELDTLADIQQKVGKPKDAVRTLQRAAELYWMMNQADKAFVLYDKIVRIAPSDVEARQQLVNLHILARRMADAVEEQRTIAQICLQANRTQEAIASLHQVIALAPEDTRAYFQLASLLASTKEYQQAYRIYSRLLKKDPFNVKVKALETQMYEKALAAGQIKRADPNRATTGPLPEPAG